MNTTAVMKQRLVLAIILLVSVLQLRAQGIVVNLKDGTNVKFPSETVENITTYGYDGSPHTGYVNGHEYVDLGLPSGTLWATCNVGASKPEAYGEYYAWGETESKRSFSYETYNYGSSAQNLQDIGSDIAGTKYDVAHVKWGAGWSMPTYEQWLELRDNTTSIWTAQNGVEGRLIKSKLYKTSIFLPAAGSYYSTSYKAGSDGRYWTSTKKSGTTHVYVGYFFAGGIGNSGSNLGYTDLERYVGNVIRPVLKSE